MLCIHIDVIRLSDMTLKWWYWKVRKTDLITDRQTQWPWPAISRVAFATNNCYPDLWARAAEAWDSGPQSWQTSWRELQYSHSGTFSCAPQQSHGECRSPGRDRRCWGSPCSVAACPVCPPPGTSQTSWASQRKLQGGGGRSGAKISWRTATE